MESEKSKKKARPRSEYKINKSKKSFLNHVQIDIEKSLSLLQAYGEYDKFLMASKTYLKHKGMNKLMKSNTQGKKKKSKKISTHGR